MTTKSFLTVDEWQADLGTQVRRARLMADETQADLARRSNVSLGALKNLESGRGAQLSTVIAVAKALGKQDWLSSFEPEQRPGPLDIMRLERELELPSRASARKD